MAGAGRRRFASGTKRWLLAGLQGFPNRSPNPEANNVSTNTAVAFAANSGGSSTGLRTLPLDTGNNSVPAVPKEPLAPTWLAAVFDDHGQVHEVHGQIMQAYFFNVGGLTGPLGYPVTDESGTPDGVGRYNHFQGGSIFWTPSTGAHEVGGAIRDEWSSLGWEKSVLGYPLSDESSTPDGLGRYNHFQNGSVYWTPATGAHEVRGAIYDRWASLGWEKSYLGYPTVDEHDCGDGSRCSTFQHGWIRWTAAGGAVDTTGVYYVHVDSFNVIRTRSAFTDTDYMALVAKMHTPSDDTSNEWDAEWPTVSDGNQPVNSVLGPYILPPDSSNKQGFSYVIVNNGNATAALGAFSVGQTALSLAGEAIGWVGGSDGSQTGEQVGSALGTTLGDLARKYLKDLTGLLAPITSFAFADCDGLVAQDEVGMTALETVTASGRHGETQTYPGSDSPHGCGSNSSYQVSWSVTRGT